MKMPAKGKYNVEIYKSWCKRCGICVAFCPAEVMALDEQGEVVVKNPERCTGCQLCELRCPDFAITVRPAKGKKSRKSGEAPANAKEETDEVHEKT
jgi:2-oxoglutarate ferredoxin oxidoreductase subunit delta